MKTSTIVRAFTNSATHAARLAAWQSKPIASRLALIREHRKPGQCCFPVGMADHSSVAEWRHALIHDPAFRSHRVPCVNGNTLHDVTLDCAHSEVTQYWQGRKILNHSGWYCDEGLSEVYEAYAVRLARFPGLIFEALSDPWNDGLVEVDLSSGVEIGYPGSSCYEATRAEEDCARDAIRSADSTAKRRAEEERELGEKERAKHEISDNKLSLKALRAEIRSLCGEVKELRSNGSALCSAFPAMSRAAISGLQSLLDERRTLITRNAELAASL